MNTKQQLARLLVEHDGEFLSGNIIAEELHVTRAAVWKAIRQLEEEGFRIEAVQNRGYRLADDHDALSESGIRRYLGTDFDLFELEVRQIVTSTNNVIKERVHELKGWHTVVADMQTAGRGRYTRQFFSPAGTGIYLSMLIRLPLAANEATRITTAAAVAACMCLEETTDEKPEIKWVNDVFLHGRKICGILTEASISLESGGLDWAIMGIGFNVYEPDGGFPEELREIAGVVCRDREKNLRNRIAASFMKYFYRVCMDLTGVSLVEEYRKRSFLPGKRIEVIKGDRRYPAVALCVDEECRLLVRYPDGAEEALSSGEVSIRI